MRPAIAARAAASPSGLDAEAPPDGPAPTAETETMVAVLAALAHPLRLRIVSALCRREITVGALALELGAAQAVVSQQLRILRMSGLVGCTREHGHARYRVVRPSLRSLVRCVERCSHG